MSYYEAYLDELPDSTFRDPRGPTWLDFFWLVTVTLVALWLVCKLVDMS